MEDVTGCAEVSERQRKQERARRITRSIDIHRAKVRGSPFGGEDYAPYLLIPGTLLYIVAYSSGNTHANPFFIRARATLYSKQH